MAFVAVLSILFFPKSSNGCDACGCSSGGNFVGLLPQFNKKFVGLRLKNNLFKVNPENFTGLGSHDDDHHHQLPHQNNYTTTELWARFYPAKRLQLMMFVPFSVNTKTEDGQTEQIKGIGDMSALLSVVVFNTTDSLEDNFRHALLLGAGVKLPTGKYQQRDDQKVAYVPNFQVGTGAYSLLMNVIYTARLGKFGFNSNLSYSGNGTAETDYHFGNTFNTAQTIFYWIKTKHISLIPNAGIFYENAKVDTQYDSPQPYTGGRNTYGTFGSEFYFGRFALGGNYQLPINKQHNNEAPISTSRFFATFSVVF